MLKNKDIGKKVIFLDANGTTIIDPTVQNVYCEWLSSYNPSSDSKVSSHAREMITKTREFIAQQIDAPLDKYEIVFTSGASEANSTIIKSSAIAFKKIARRQPHIIISAYEHASIIDACAAFERAGLLDVSKVEPNIHGVVAAADFERLIRPQTCLISCIFGHNELGTINNVHQLAKVAHRHHIPFHSDCTQIFGKFKMQMQKNDIDAISVSYHKFYGPKGIGLLIMKKSLVEGYKLEALINGHQQNSLRGGTENVAAIASTIPTFKNVFKNRQEKNERMKRLRDLFIERLGKIYPIGDYVHYAGDENARPIEEREILILGPQENILPNTILACILARDIDFCNVEFKHALDKRGIIVSIGAACLTDSKEASHVLNAIRAPKIVKRGVFRVSLSDYTTKNDIEESIDVIKKVLKLDLTKKAI